MTVYIVETLVDDEYGNYEVYKVFDSLEKAQNEINKLGNNKVDVWFDNDGLEQYVIEEYKVY